VVRPGRGVLARSVGDLDLAEEVVQDALRPSRWPRRPAGRSAPDHPRTVRNRAIDGSAARGDERERQAVELEALRRDRA
jgi:predicted RNA polymerase sigma factor